MDTSHASHHPSSSPSSISNYLAMGAFKRIKETLTRKSGQDKTRRSILPTSGSEQSSLPANVERKSTRGTLKGILKNWGDDNRRNFETRGNNTGKFRRQMSSNRSSDWEHETLRDQLPGGQMNRGDGSSSGSDGPAGVDGSRNSGGQSGHGNIGTLVSCNRKSTDIGKSNGSSPYEANGSGQSGEQNNEEGKASSEFPPIQTPEIDTGSSNDDVSSELNGLGDHGEPWATTGDYYDNRQSWHTTGATVGHSEDGDTSNQKSSVVTISDGGNDILDGPHFGGRETVTEPERDDESDILPPHHRNSSGRNSIHADYLRKYDNSPATGSHQSGRNTSKKLSYGSHGCCRPTSHDHHKDMSDDDEDHDQMFKGMNDPTSFSIGGPKTSASPSNNQIAATPGSTDANGYKDSELVEGIIPDWQEDWDEEWVEHVKLTSDDNYEEGFESFLRYPVSTPSAGCTRYYGRDFGRRFHPNTLARSEKHALNVLRTLSPTKNNPSKSIQSKSAASESTGVIKRKETTVFVLGPVLGERKHTDDFQPTLGSETSLANWIDLKHLPTADALKHALLNGKAVSLGPDLRVPFKVINIDPKEMGNSRKDLAMTKGMVLSHTAFQRPNSSYRTRLWQVSGEIEEGSALQPVQ